jgi:hypothetical protein
MNSDLQEAYFSICRRAHIRPEGKNEITAACSTLCDMALLGIGKGKEGLRRVTMRVSKDDVAFALQTTRFFKHLLVDELTL